MPGSPAVQRFHQLARRYCSLIDDATQTSVEQFVREVYPLLTAIHSTALELDWRPWSDESEEDEAVPSVENNLDAFYERLERLRGLLGERDTHIHVMYPYEDDEAIENSLACDLAELDEDLRNGLTFADAGDPLAAEANWSMNFEVHWGNHLLWALLPLHSGWRDLLDEDEENNETDDRAEQT